MSEFRTKVHFSLTLRSSSLAEMLGAVCPGPCTIPGLIEAGKELSAEMSVAVIAVQVPNGPSYLWPCVPTRAGGRR